MESWKGKTTIKSPGETALSPQYSTDRIFQYVIITNTGNTNAIINIYIVYGSYSILIAPKNIELVGGIVDGVEVHESYVEPHELMLKKGEQFKIVASGSTIDYYFTSKD